MDGPLAEQFSWELERCCELGLQANPTVLECLWSPIVEHTSPAGDELLSLRRAFLSRRVAQSYDGYAYDQLQRLESARRRTDQVKWKQAMHMLRLLLAGAHVARTGDVLVDASSHREELLAVKHGRLSWDDIQALASTLDHQLQQAAGICGNSLSRARIFGSTASTIDPDPGRIYRGGCTDRTALRTVFLARRSLFAIALIDICSARYSRRISAQSSTVITLPSRIVEAEGVNIHPQRVSFHPEPTGSKLKGVIRARPCRYPASRGRLLWRPTEGPQIGRRTPSPTTPEVAMGRFADARSSAS